VSFSPELDNLSQLDFIKNYGFRGIFDEHYIEVLDRWLFDDEAIIIDVAEITSVLMSKFLRRMFWLLNSFSLGVGIASNNASGFSYI